MSKKDYVKIADIIISTVKNDKNLNSSQIENLVYGFIEVLKADNNAFNSCKFRDFIYTALNLKDVV